MGIWLSDEPVPSGCDEFGNPWINAEQSLRVSVLLKRWVAGDEAARAELVALHLAWGYDADWIDASLKEVATSWQAPPWPPWQRRGTPPGGGHRLGRAAGEPAAVTARDAGEGMSDRRGGWQRSDKAT